MLAESTFEPLRIYNEASLPDTTDPSETKRPGEVYRNNDAIYTLDLKRGLMRIEKVSFAEFEEDLATMYGAVEKQDFRLGEVRHKELIRYACSEVLKLYGHYLNPERVAYLFPDIDLNNVDSYTDFSAGHLKFFVLKRTDLPVIAEVFDEEYVPNTAGLRFKERVNTLIHPSFKQPYYIKQEILAPNSLILITETSEKMDTTMDFNDPDTRIACETRMKQIVRHEVLHALRPDDPLFPRMVEEGIVNCFAIMANDSEGHVYTGYEDLTELVTILTMFATQEKLKPLPALIGCDPKAVAKFKEDIAELLGSKFAKAFFKDGFIRDEDIKKQTQHIFSRLSKDTQSAVSGA